MQADDPLWLHELVARSPLLPDASLRKHWQRLIPHLPPAAKYELADILQQFEEPWRT